MTSSIQPRGDNKRVLVLYADDKRDKDVILKLRKKLKNTDVNDGPWRTPPDSIGIILPPLKRR